MSDFAELSIGVSSAGLKQGRDEMGRFTAAAERTEARTERAGRRISASFRRIGAVAGLAAGALATAFGGRAIVSTLATFDTSMAQVQAITRASSEDMEALRATAQAMGSTTEFSAAQAADGLRFLGMAGFSASEAMDAIPGVLDLATAASMGLAEAADTASNIMSGFGIEAANAAGVADVLAAASSRANTDVRQLGSAMSTVAPIAASLDISLADTAAAIGILSDAGIQGERAGTAMRGVLASLAGPTTQAAGALSGLGLSVQDVNPAAHDLATIMGRLRDAGMTTADAMTIFGREASSGAIILAGGAGRLAEFGQELSNVSGEASRMAGVMRDTLGGDLNALKSVVEALIIAMGDAGLTAVLRGIVQTMSFVVGSVAALIQGATGAVLSFGEMIGGFEGYFIAAAGAVTTYFLPAILSAAARISTTLVGAVWAAVTGTAAWIAKLITLRGALIATGTGAFIVGAGLAINYLLDLKEKTGSWGEALTLLGDVARGVWEGIVSSSAAIPLGLAGTWARVRAGFRGMIAGMSSMWADFLDMIAPDIGRIETPFGTLDFGEMMGIGGIADAARNFSQTQGARAAMELSNSSVQLEAAGALVSESFNGAREALTRLREVMSDTGTDTVETSAAIAEINTALGQTPVAAANAASGVQQVGDAADETQARMERFASGITRALMQIVKGGAAARNAISQLLNRAAEMMMNRAVMALLGRFSGGKGGGFMSFLGSLLSFDGGGHTGTGPRSGGVDGKGGFPAILHPNETVIDHTKARSVPANHPQVLHVYVHAEESEMFRPIIRAESGDVAAQVSSEIVARNNRDIRQAQRR